MAIIDDYADINRRMNFRSNAIVGHEIDTDWVISIRCSKTPPVDRVYEKPSHIKYDISEDFECRPTPPLWQIPKCEKIRQSLAWARAELDRLREIKD